MSPTASYDSHEEILKKIRRIEIRTSGWSTTCSPASTRACSRAAGWSSARCASTCPATTCAPSTGTSRRARDIPFVKKFEEERELTIMFVVDASGSGRVRDGRRASRSSWPPSCAPSSRSPRRATTTASGSSSSRDRVEKVVPPQKGRRHVLRVVRELLYSEPEGTGTDIPMALDYLSNVVRRHAVVFLVSDFLTEGYESALAVANRRYDLIAVDVSDPREHELPRVGTRRAGGRGDGGAHRRGRGRQEVRRAIRARGGETAGREGARLQEARGRPDRGVDRPALRRAARALLQDESQASGAAGRRAREAIELRERNVHIGRRSACARGPELPGRGALGRSPRPSCCSRSRPLRRACRCPSRRRSSPPWRR